MVFTLPAPVADIAYQNKAAIYDILFKASAETLTTIAADPKHLGARIGITSVLHTWGSALTHHPHVHMIVPGGGIALDGKRWVSCRPGFFLPVRVLSRLFRRLFLDKLAVAHAAGRLKFFGDHAALAAAQAFAAYLAPLRKTEWVVYAKKPFGGPQAVLAYLSRYTHRVAIANSRLIACNRAGERLWLVVGALCILIGLAWWRRHGEHLAGAGDGVAAGAAGEQAVVTDTVEAVGQHVDKEAADELAGSKRHGLEALAPVTAVILVLEGDAVACPCCGGRMIIIETFRRGSTPRYRLTAPPAAIRIDTS